VGPQGLAKNPKKARQTRAHLVLIDESGLFLNPLVRRTWALKGQTPVLRTDGGHRKKVSVIGAISVSPQTQRLGFYFATEPNGFYTTDKVVEFLRHLLKHLRGRVIVVWDGGPNHRGPALREFLTQHRRLHLERLPPWAPDHNPVEAVWSWIKYGELANFVPRDLDHLNGELVDRLIELRFSPRLLKALWNRSELPFPNHRKQ
jgi:putative transposase